MSVQIRGSGGDLAVVDENGAMAVNLPGSESAAGKVVGFFEADSGSMTGSALRRSPRVDQTFRLRVGIDTLLENDTWNAGAQNTAKYLYRNTTMTGVWSGGFLTTNASSITTLSTGIVVNSWRMFPTFGGAPISIGFTAGFSAAMPTNTTVDFGLATCGTSNPYAPTDGVYFRRTPAGWFGCVNFSGTESEVAFPTAFDPGINAMHRFRIVCGERSVEFWVDEVLRLLVPCPASNGSPFMAATAPLFVRHVISASAASAVMQMKVSDLSVAVLNYHSSKPWSHQMAGMGLMAYQAQNGGTMGTLASYANNADPTAAAALSNSAALVTGLGGQFRFNAAATAVTDGIVTSWLNPPGTVAVTPRTLYLTGLKISCANMGAAVATTATTLAWSLAFGHSAVSLATSEAATTKAPRRIALGLMSWPVGAAIGAMPERGDLVMKFDSPVVVNPGEFIATVAKFIVGTATASQVIWGHVTFDGYFE